MKNMNRREFIKKTGVAAAITGSSLWLPKSSWAGANDRMQSPVSAAGVVHISGVLLD